MRSRVPSIANADDIGKGILILIFRNHIDYSLKRMRTFNTGWGHSISTYTPKWQQCDPLLALIYTCKYPRCVCTITHLISPFISNRHAFKYPNNNSIEKKAVKHLRDRTISRFSRFYLRFSKFFGAWRVPFRGFSVLARAFRTGCPS